MEEYLPTGIRIPRTNVMESKKRNIMITIYGPYGDFKDNLTEISSILQTKHGFTNCKLVSERQYCRVIPDHEKYITKKSFYFLRKSNVIVFIFFCDKRQQNKISHGESPASELTHLIDTISQ